jgi:hypothetical protein
MRPLKTRFNAAWIVLRAPEAAAKNSIMMIATQGKMQIDRP